MLKEKRLSSDKAKKIGDEIGIDWAQLEVEQFRMGLQMELGHGVRDAEASVTNTDLLLTGKMVRAHLSEYPNYYLRLLKREKEDARYWKNV
jgi:hypothetical protein